MKSFSSCTLMNMRLDPVFDRDVPWVAPRATSQAARAVFAIGACTTLLFASAATAQEVNGSLAANGKSAVLKYAIAQEVDSTTEKGYLDVIVVLSDRKIGAADARDVERLEALTRRDGLVALVVRLNPDARVMSAEPLHPAFTTFVSSAAFVRWKPSAYDEKRVAGRFWTEGTQNEFRQQWSYDVTFSTPITLDPVAKTVPKK
jgi:CBS domain-containing protein